MPNVYKSKLDIKNVRSDFRPTFIQYDHAILEIELLDNGFPYNLSTANRVEFTHVREDGLVIIQEGEIVTYGGVKIIRYEYKGSEMDLIGTIKTSFAIFDVDNKKVSTHSFDVVIVRDLRDEIFSPAEPNFGLLQVLLNDVRDIKENGGGGSGGVGPQGPPGRDGRDGIDGKSAYQIAVSNGFTGTEAQWLASLKGETEIADNTVSKEKLTPDVISGIADIVDLKDYLYAITDKDGRLSEIILNNEGQIPSWVLTAWKDRMGVTALQNTLQNTLQNSGEIVAWGDSLTAWGGDTSSYIAEVGRLSGKTVRNNGVGGEPSNTIASRQGGLVMMVNNITIPSSASDKVLIATDSNPLKDNTGGDCRPLRQGDGGINPCYINGIKGILSSVQSNASSNDYELYFQRETNGNAVVINRPTPIITDGAIKRRNDIMVIFIGQNGGYTDDNELISQIKAMVDYNTTTRKEYIVLGLTSSTASYRAPLEKAMTQAFGRRYINLRDYLSTYGMADLGLTPTQNDLSAMANGSVPPSMLLDTVHHTDATRQLIGRLVYERMLELGIL